MKKIVFLLLSVALLAFALSATAPRSGLGELSLQSFARLFSDPAAREVFGVEEEEARAVFGEEEGAVFL